MNCSCCGKAKAELAGARPTEPLCRACWQSVYRFGWRPRVELLAERERALLTVRRIEAALDYLITA